MNKKLFFGILALVGSVAVLGFTVARIQNLRSTIGLPKAATSYTCGSLGGNSLVARTHANDSDPWGEGKAYTAGSSVIVGCLSSSGDGIVSDSSITVRKDGLFYANWPSGGIATMANVSAGSYTLYCGCSSTVTASTTFSVGSGGSTTPPIITSDCSNPYTAQYGSPTGTITGTTPSFSWSWCDSSKISSSMVYLWTCNPSSSGCTSAYAQASGTGKTSLSISDFGLTTLSANTTYYWTITPNSCATFPSTNCPVGTGPGQASFTTGTTTQTCNSSNCSGCCSGTTCVALTSQSTSTCGTAGAACQSCSSSQTCQTGVCTTPAAANCTYDSDCSTGLVCAFP